MIVRFASNIGQHLGVGEGEEPERSSREGELLATQGQEVGVETEEAGVFLELPHDVDEACVRGQG